LAVLPKSRYRNEGTQEGKKFTRTAAQERGGEGRALSGKSRRNPIKPLEEKDPKRPYAYREARGEKVYHPVRGVMEGGTGKKLRLAGCATGE